MDITGLTKISGYRIVVKGRSLENIFTTSPYTAERIMKEFTSKGTSVKMNTENLFQRENGNLLSEIKLTEPTAEDAAAEALAATLLEFSAKLTAAGITLEEIRQYLIAKGEELR